MGRVTLWVWGRGRLPVQTGSLSCGEKGPRRRGHLGRGLETHPLWAAWTPHRLALRIPKPWSKLSPTSLPNSAVYCTTVGPKWEGDPSDSELGGAPCLGGRLEEEKVGPLQSQTDPQLYLELISTSIFAVQVAWPTVLTLTA